MSSSSRAGKKRKTGKGDVYTSATDVTLTAAQQRLGGFRPDVVDTITKGGSVSGGRFRWPSNPTDDNLSSGYHESVVVTDATNVLARRSRSKGGQSRLPKVSSGYWKRHSGVSFPEANLAPLLKVGDASRTDTARTILSGPHGTAAGHSGSGVRTTHQGPAHDLLRDLSVKVLTDKHLTPNAIAAIAAATTVTSIAPGKLAGTASGAAKLKHQRSRKTWEADRNEGKRRAGLLFDDLPSAQQKRVRAHVDSYVRSLGDSKRRLDKKRATSPPRDTGPSSKHAAIHGGDYQSSRKKARTSAGPRTAPHASPSERTLFATQPFRLPRSSAGKRKRGSS